VRHARMACADCATSNATLEGKPTGNLKHLPKNSEQELPPFAKPSALAAQLNTSSAS